jgi:hypothetical protein
MPVWVSEIQTFDLQDIAWQIGWMDTGCGRMNNWH